MVCARFHASSGALDMVRPMLHVFHREHAGRPIRVLWLLEEIGEPYELTIMDWEQGSSEEHVKRQPLGRVPVVQFDDGYVFESAAICLHLADLHPDAGLVSGLGTYGRALAKFPEPFPQVLDEYLTRLFERPAYKRALARASAPAATS